MRPRRFARFENWWHRSQSALESYRRATRRGLCCFFTGHGKLDDESPASWICRRCGKLYSLCAVVLPRKLHCRFWLCNYRKFRHGYTPTENGNLIQIQYDSPLTFDYQYTCAWCRHATRHDALDDWIDCQLRPLRKIRNALCRFIYASVPIARRCSFVRRHGTDGGVPLVS